MFLDFGSMVNTCKGLNGMASQTFRLVTILLGVMISLVHRKTHDYFIQVFQ